MMDKKELRRKFKNIRISMHKTEREKSDQLINDKFLLLNEYKECEDLLVYVSSEIEVSTQKIISNSLKEKRVLCPRCVPGTNLMYFYRIQNIDQLKTGSFGILEPDLSCEKIDDFKNPLCVVPALSYDHLGYRLGFGKGFYDRFLRDFKGISVGLCYDCCVTDELPSDDFDICVYKLITEKSIYDFKTRKDG